MAENSFEPVGRNQNYESRVHLNLESKEGFWMHTHAQHMSKQGDQTTYTYRVDMAYVSQIRYLLSGPVTCPIYIVSGGIPRGFPSD